MREQKMKRNMYITYLLLLLLLRISMKKSRKNGLKRDCKKRHLYIDTLNGVRYNADNKVIRDKDR